MAEIEAVVVESGGVEAGASVIWLHGLGADGHDFEPIIPELQLPDDLGVRFIFPHAPVRPVTLNGGMAMRAWYDIISLDRNGLQDEAGIRASAELLAGLVQQEQDRGIPAGRIVVAGFSQGGAIALHQGLRATERLGGILALSTYLPLKDRFAAEVTATSVPIFMAHGTLDPVLPMVLGQESAELLRDAGFQLEWHEYPMAHSVCLEEITAIRGWLLSVLGDE